MKRIINKLPVGLLLILIYSFSMSVYAQTCSPYKGKATLNEFFKDKSNQSNSANDFLEIKILDLSVTYDEFKEWTIDVCEKDANGNNQDNHGCASDENGGNRLLLSSFGDTTPEWLVLDSSDSDNEDEDIGNFINFKTGFDAILKDKNGLVIDYLSVGYSELEDSNCPGTSLPFDSDAGAPGNSDKFIFRNKDGSGNWDFENSAAAEGTKNSSNDGDGVAFGYYVISFSGNGITCEPFTVTVSAVDADGSPLVVAAGTVLTISTDIANDGWTNPTGPGGTYTVTTDTATVQFQLRKMNPASLEIDVSDSDGNTDDDGSRDDDIVVFANAGFRFYADNVVDAIGMQYSGKSSFDTPGEQTLTIKAVQSSASDPGVCEALIVNTSADINIAYQCDDPATCATSTEALAINSMEINDSSSALISVSLNFDASGVAEFTLSYIDAGLITLLASADLPVNDTTGPLGTASVIGSSNSFLVRPAGLCVQAKESATTYNVCPRPPSSPTDFDTCDVYRTVGESFELEVSSRAWTGSGEANSDFCDNNISKNFVLGNIALSNKVVAPTGGENAVLSVTATSISGSNGYVDESVSIDEVGVFTFTAKPDDAYHLQTISSSTSVAVGRFKPHHFEIDNGSVLPASGTFSYLGQPFEVQYDISAVDAFGKVTTNYRNADSGENFIKLTDDNDISYGAVDSTSGTIYLTSRLSKLGTENYSWSDGVAAIQVQLVLARGSSLDEPSVHIGAMVSDSDDVTLQVADLDLDTEDPPAGVDKKELGILAAEFKYGRVYIPPVYGPEIPVGEITDVPFIIQFWDSVSSSFKENTDDSISSYKDWQWTTASHCFDPELSDSLVCTDTAVNIPQMPTASTVVSSGAGVLSINRPGAPGVLNMEVVVDDWLQYNWQIDWDQDDTTVDDLNPSFQVNFGTYRGHDRIIYWREKHDL